MQSSSLGPRPVGSNISWGCIEEN